ncbi:MAG: DUF4230 domain-containing protein [Chitinophagaceae bacterium]|nr:DUF4230 domain-containing protein [Chitinophagaceae bacterium]
MRKVGWGSLLQWLLVFIVMIWLLNKLSKIPSMRSLFTAEKVVIDQTPILIKNIKSIARLVTVTAYDEVVVDSLVYNRTAAFIDMFRTVSPMAMLPSLQKQLVIIGKGKVLAGTNLQKLTDKSISTHNDTAWIQLPRAEILEAIINPSDFETFEERGQWSDNEVIAVKVKARNKMIARAMERGILDKANKKATAVIENFLQAAGFKVVYLKN